MLNCVCIYTLPVYRGLSLVDPCESRSTIPVRVLQGGGWWGTNRDRDLNISGRTSSEKWTSYTDISVTTLDKIYPNDTLIIHFSVRILVELNFLAPEGVCLA